MVLENIEKNLKIWRVPDSVPLFCSLEVAQGSQYPFLLTGWEFACPGEVTVSLTLVCPSPVPTAHVLCAGLGMASYEGISLPVFGCI